MSNTKKGVEKMDLSLLFKKNNALVDGNIPNRKVIANKLVNALYYKYEKEGAKFNIAIADLLKLLNITDCGKSREILQDGLKILQEPIQLRNFTYNGEGIKWYSSAFLQVAKIVESNINYIQIQLSDELITGLKQKSHYTVIDLETSNKFKTKYGIVIWEMYLRYKNADRNGVPSDTTYQMFTLKELNEKFGTKHKYVSKLLEGVERGLKEVEAITGKKIAIKWQTAHNKLAFFWKKEKEKPKFMQDKNAFIRYIRENHTNIVLLTINFESDIYKGEIDLYCDNEGHLADGNKRVNIGKRTAEGLWEYLFTHQNQITAIRQTTINDYL